MTPCPYPWPTKKREIEERDREKKVTEGEEEKVVERGDSIKCLSRKHRMIINKVTEYTEH